MPVTDHVKHLLDCLRSQIQKWSFAVYLKKWQLKKTSGKQIMCSFMWFIRYIKICYLYLNKSRSVGEHCKAYKLKSEVLKITPAQCTWKPGMLLLWEHLLPTIVARLYPAPCFTCRLSLLLIRAFSLSVFLQVLLVFILIKLTFRIPITLQRTISWDMWNFCSLILICFHSHLQAKIKFFGIYGYKPGIPKRRNRTQPEKNCEILKLLSRNFIFSWKESVRWNIPF